MSGDDLDVRWGLAKRFEFIEWRAYWTGRVNRKDLEDQFHISTPQASQDFQNYLKVAPDNIVYDGTLKTYVTTATFRPKFFSLQSAERYLRQLQALKINAIELADTWFGDVPPADVIPPIARAPQPYALQPILQAIQERKSIAIDYISLDRQGIRNICPHALAHDGYRWHVRGLSIER
ncbi:MAG: hypothetical protein QOD26_2657, partial [Betaproteobacteria bacterium]|nr:hypothetical protein [Betaproteobacteria bacterium]